MTKFSCLLAVMTFTLSHAMPAGADEIPDLFAKARAQYDSGELRKSVQTLQFVVASIQEKINLDFLKLLPEPRDGWQADEPQAQTAGMAAMIAGTNLSRRYFRSDGAQVEISILADSPVMPMVTMMLSNPMMLQASPDIKVYTHSGWRGTIRHDKDGDGWEVRLLVANKILVEVQGHGLKDQGEVDAYLKEMDLDAVEKAFRD